LMHIADKMFRCLTEKGADNREIRRPKTLQKICDIVDAPPATVRQVIEGFRRPDRSFLRPPVGIELKLDETIDISHESLIRQWKQLRTWVEAESASAKEYLRLVDAAARFESGQGGLLHDPDLRYALNWKAASRPNAAWANLYAPHFEKTMQFLSKSSHRATARKTALIAVVIGVVGGSAVVGVRENRLQAALAATQHELATKYQREAEERTKMVLREFGWKSSQLSSINAPTGGSKLPTKAGNAPPLETATTAIEQSLAADRERQKILAAASGSTGRAEISVQYFPKDVDGKKVESALEESGFSMDRRQAPVSDIPTNAIWFGSVVSIQEVKLVAYTLIRAGVPIKTIRPFTATSPRRDQALIQVGADRAYVDKDPLTVDEVRGLSQFTR